MKSTLIVAATLLLGMASGCGGDDDDGGQADGAKVVADSSGKPAADSAKPTEDSSSTPQTDTGTDNGSCADLCEEAQDGSCTDVKGDCSSFCQAVNNAKGAANCTSQYDAYLKCLGSKANVCDANCDSAEGDLKTCFTAYCATHLQDKDCQTMVASFI
jgi:hypothetical protein